MGVALGQAGRPSAQCHMGHAAPHAALVRSPRVLPWPIAVQPLACARPCGPCPHFAPWSAGLRRTAGEGALFEFDAAKQWRERGRGEMRVNVASRWAPWVPPVARGCAASRVG